MNLQLDETTWILFALTVALWAASAWLAGERSERSLLGWRIIPLSVFGFAWLSFGADYIARFLFLAYDPELFRVTLYTPGLLPAEVLSQTWLALGLFWLTLCLGYAAMLIWLKPVTPAWLTPLLQFNRLASPEAIGLLDKIFIISVILTPLSVSPWVPQGLVTPIGLIIYLYAIPLIISWQLYFQGQPIGLRRFIYMLPGIILYYLSPYRLHLVLPLACIMLPAILFKPRLAFYKVVLGIIIFLILSTAVNDTYRKVIWNTRDKYVRESLSKDWETWQENPDESPWIRLVKRFHGFDSTAITINAVPSFFPYSNHDVVTETLVTAFLPRALYDTKPEKARGREFSVTIWAWSEHGLMRRNSSMIAPSITGDLYRVHGLPMICLGGILLGLVIGLLEKTRFVIGKESQCIWVGLFGLTVALGLETDFVFTMGTLLQRFIIVYLAAFIIAHVQFSPKKVKELAES